MMSIQKAKHHESGILTGRRRELRLFCMMQQSAGCQHHVRASKDPLLIIVYSQYTFSSPNLCVLLIIFVLLDVYIRYGD